MRSLSQRIFSFLVSRASSRKGQTLVEYSLILVILGVVFIAVFRLLSNEIVVIFSAITTLMDSAQASTF